MPLGGIRGSSYWGDIVVVVWEGCVGIRVVVCEWEDDRVMVEAGKRLPWVLYRCCLVGERFATVVRRVIV